MKRTRLAINILNGKQQESRVVTAEVTGEWAGGIKVWTDEEGNQYSLHRVDGTEYFILEAVDSLETSWTI